MDSEDMTFEKTLDAIVKETPFLQMTIAIMNAKIGVAAAQKVANYCLKFSKPENTEAIKEIVESLAAKRTFLEEAADKAQALDQKLSKILEMPRESDEDKDNIAFELVSTNSDHLTEVSKLLKEVNPIRIDLYALVKFCPLELLPLLTVAMTNINATVNTFGFEFRLLSLFSNPNSKKRKTTEFFKEIDKSIKQANKIFYEDVDQKVRQYPTTVRVEF